MDTNRASPTSDVCAMYDNTADAYAKMMDGEIDLPIYGDVLGRLAGRIDGLAGPVVDTSSGSGHMLFRYRERFDPERALVGVDLSPQMVAITRAKLGQGVEGVVPGKGLPSSPRLALGVQDAVWAVEPLEVVIATPAEKAPGDAMLGIASVGDDAAVLHGGQDAARVGAVTVAGRTQYRWHVGTQLTWAQSMRRSTEGDPRSPARA